MRTSPYDFQGLGEEGLKILGNTCKKHHLYSVLEIVSTDDIDKSKDVDIIQIGARNMQN